MTSTSTFSKAIRLYEQYKTCTQEFKAAAADLGYSDTNSLTAAIWRHNHPDQGADLKMAFRS